MEKYIYGIIQTTQDHTFGRIGLKDEEVLTIGFEGLAVVTSNYDLEEGEKVKNSRKNMIAHQKVVEVVMEEFTILPMQFGTIARRHDEIQNMLSKRYNEFVGLLRGIEGKIELGVKALWINMEEIYLNLVEKNTEIKELKIRLSKNQDTGSLIEVGQRVEQALAQEKEQLAEEMLNTLKDAYLEYKIADNMTEAMFLNASFLVNKSREVEFDHLIEELDEKYGAYVKFKYVGPMAPYSFIDLTIKPEEWEV